MNAEDREFAKSGFNVSWDELRREVPKWPAESRDSAAIGSDEPVMLEFDIARFPVEERSAFNTIELGRGYPYVLFRPAGLQSNPNDLYTLEAADGSYSKTLSASCARPGPFGFPVFWFPPPPEGPMYHLRYRPAPGAAVAEYYIFRDQRLSLLEGGNRR
jgi:hypothetical protein